MPTSTLFISPSLPVEPHDEPALPPEDSATSAEQYMSTNWPLVQRWQSHIHLLFIASSSVAALYGSRTVLVRGWTASSCGATLGDTEYALLSHRQFYVMVPELRRLQLNALFVYLGKQALLFLPFAKPFNFKLSGLVVRVQKARHRLGKVRRFRSMRALNFRKNFIRLRRLYFERLRTSFFYHSVRPKAAKRLLARFTNKNNLALNLMFNLNPHKLVCRIFPFMDRFLLRNMLKRGELFVNNNRLGKSFNTLKLGDMVRMSLSTTFVRIYRGWVTGQQAYLAIMSRNLHQHYKAQRQKNHKRRKQYLTRFTWYTGFYKAIPAWLEVNFLSMSFFIVKTPTKLTFRTASFNPYLNRLLAFR